MPARRSFRQTLADAIAAMSRDGYTSADQVERWLRELRAAAEAELGTERLIDDETRAQLDALYQRLIEKGKITDYVPGVGRFTLAMVRPELRAELDRRILASANLIKLHRKEAVDKTLQRFSGWSTSIPVSGRSEETKREVTKHVGKALKQFRFEQRRVAIDQGHKLIANIADIVATDSGAIAAIWHSHWRRMNYDYRPEHKARDGKIFLIRDSWAMKEGLIKRGSAKYIDEIEMPAQLPYCSCFYQYIMSPRRLPEDMLTEKGREWIARGKAT